MRAIEHIEAVIKKELKISNKGFIIYPYGIPGQMVAKVLKERFSIEPLAIIDNGKGKRGGCVGILEDLRYLEGSENEMATILVATANPNAAEAIMKSLEPYRGKFRVVDVFPLIVGKHTWGEGILGNYTGYQIEKIGAFCSFASGSCVVGNHDMRGVSTSALFNGIILDEDAEEFRKCVDELKVDGLLNVERCSIGNDVWLGRNVVICNGAKIGDGVIVGAGAVILEDIPDYAICVGIPAKVVKYRYSEEQIEALKSIRWWEWSDKKIAQYYDDFSDIQLFIDKHMFDNEGR